MPYQRLARMVLEEWRKLERDWAQLETNSAEAAFFRTAADVLRDEYQHLVDAATLSRPALSSTLPKIRQSAA